MATAYAAVVSLMHVMEHIQSYHARQPIFLDEQQMQLQSLNQFLCAFQDFLECYSHGGSEEVGSLEVRIANAAHAAEDIIETHIVDDICDRAEGHEKKSSSHFSLLLREVIEGMDSIHEEVMEIREKCTPKQQVPQNPAPAPTSSLLTKKDTVMVYDEDLNHIVDKLMDQRSSLQVISITGMGGIGKTTLAKIAYENLSVASHFDVRGWVTISQQHDVPKILFRLLNDMHVPYVSEIHKRIPEQLRDFGSKLHHHLYQKRYLVVLDDIWSIEAWDKLKAFLPDYNNGSRIIVTSRFLNVAKNFTSSDLYQMNLLDEDKSWSLLCRKVFGEQNCPPELVDIGKMITKNCKGLPLSIGSIGGLLIRSNMTREYWEYVAENTKSLGSNDEENCLNILSLSYSQLPIHLKPCFLYLGVFSEDYEIRVSKLIKLWVAEGILKPNRAETLEQVGKYYLKDLIDRNLLSITKLGCTGNVKYCRIHGLLRDMCRREAQKEKFLHIESVYMPNGSQGINMHFSISEFRGDPHFVKLINTDFLKGTNSKRRVAIHLKPTKEYNPHDLSRSQSTSFLRSLIWDFKLDFTELVDFRLLRVFDVYRYNSSKAIFQLINSRHLSFRLTNSRLPSSISMLWNLQTIIIDGGNGRVTAPIEIWKLPQLRHLIGCGFILPDPPISQMDGQVMENLQTLSSVCNIKITEEVVQKIPNVRKLKLKLEYWGELLGSESLNNVRHLKKLQSLHCEFPDGTYNDIRDVLGFSSSLRKLMLGNVRFTWEEINAKIGSLPHLEKLIFRRCSTRDDSEWNLVEGHFLSLKFLQFIDGDYLDYWKMENVHFPVLEHLVLDEIRSWHQTIPSDIGYIATLRSIRLNSCSESVIDSAKKILIEQQSLLGNDGLSLLVDGKPVIIIDIVNWTYKHATI